MLVRYSTIMYINLLIMLVKPCECQRMDLLHHTLRIKLCSEHVMHLVISMPLLDDFVTINISH